MSNNQLSEHDSRDILRHTPMKSESRDDQWAREQRHRAMLKDDQPYMVVIMGIFDYGVLSINETQEQAERELAWWQGMVRQGLAIHPFSSRPSPNDLMVRQQWDLDALTAAIHRGYER